MQADATGHCVAEEKARSSQTQTAGIYNAAGGAPFQDMAPRLLVCTQTERRILRV